MVDEKNLKVLLIAYAYPPLWEAQSVRWYYLSKELAKSGIQIDVLTVSYPGEIENLPGIKVYRTFPGPFNKIVFKAISNPSVFSAKIRRSSKFFIAKKLYRIIRKFLEYLMLGDTRNEWFFIGYSKALKLIKENNYDFLITSHEPIVDTLLGLALKNKTKIRWIADLADPISADYYPSFWRPILKKIEKETLKKADLIIVTNEALKKKYEKIANSVEKILVVTQGFDLDFFKSYKKTNENQKFTLAYTGSFYKEFRNPEELIKALKRLDFDFELRLAGRLENFLPHFKGIKKKVNYLGVLSHKKVLEVQVTSDVLIYLGNKLEDQVPGKIFEYFGSKRPILCIIQNEKDPMAKTVKALGVGEVCLNEEEEIYKALNRFYERWINNEIDSVYFYDEGKIKHFSWQNQAQKFLDFIKKFSKNNF